MPTPSQTIITVCLLGMISSPGFALQTGINAPKQLKVDESNALSSLAEQVDVNKPELVQTRFPTGEIKIERWVIENKNGDFVNHGEYVEFDTEGNVVCAGTYKDGKRSGPWSKLITTNQVKNLVPELPAGFQSPFESKAEFDKGLLSKDWSCTDSKGNLVFLWNFKNGKRNGESIWLNPRGQTTQSINFKDNLAHGPAITLLDSKAPTESQFENGLKQKVVTEYYPQKSRNKRFIRSRNSYLVPTKLNLQSHNWDKSKISFSPTLEHQPIPHGPFAHYYPSGQKECQGNYVHGKKVGEFLWWYSNGQKKVRGRYEEDLESGDWSWWHENGIRMARGTYANGVKVNKWSTWSPDGKLLKRVIPSNDAPQNSVERVAELPELKNIK